VLEVRDAMPRPQRCGSRRPRALKAAGRVDADVLADQTMFEGLRERLYAALSKLELREQDVARQTLTAHNAFLENELKRVERHNLNILEEMIVLKKAAAKRR
jgi:hypothetical protein